MWVTHTLIPNVRVQNWYNGAPPYGLRGYLDDRVNRIIGYAVVRQIREKPGTCHTNKLMRDYVDSCTGQLGVPLFYEDTKTYCQGQWRLETGFIFVIESRPNLTNLHILQQAE